MNNIEEIFKNSLKDIEAPFDPKAWEAMSKRLDQKLPVQSPKNTFKWPWIAASLLTIGIVAYLILQEKGVGTDLSEKLASHNNVSLKEVQVKVENNSEKAALQTKINKNSFEDKNLTTENQVTEEKEHLNSIQLKKIDYFNTIEQPQLNASVMEIILPKMNARYCENEILTIHNQNDQSISLLSNNGFTQVLKEKKSVSVDLSTGEYFFSYTQNGKMEKEFAFVVYPRAKADFNSDEEMFFHKGLPVNNLSSINTANKYTWTDEKGIVLSRDKSFDAHFFTKGIHSITLTTSTENGCESKITKSIRCESSYNLLAMNSFIPTSANAKVNTFLPYALLERNIPFTMQIIDTKTGQTIYETKSESEPWDGIDKRSQQLIPANTPYIWRVNVDKAELGESKNYQGTITRFED